MKKKILIILAIVSSLGVIAGWAVFSIREWFAPPTVTAKDVMAETLKKRAVNAASGLTLPTSSPKFAALGSEINILLLGLDARKSTTTSPHCDAIHMFTLDTKRWTVHITSIPRGTYAYIPPGNLQQSQYYISNACRIAGHQYAIKQIEKFLNKKADYVVKVNFSQTLGLLRLFKLPTTESLMWLRNRKSFAIGDPQRSHNQAMFMKDTAVRKIGLFKNTAMIPLIKIGYSYVDTNLDFSSFYALFKGYADSGLADHPERITLSMWPSHQTRDWHFDFNNPAVFVTQFKILTYASSTTSTLAIRPLAAVQSELIRFLEQRLASKQPISDVFEKQLWLQVETERVREELHFEFLKRKLKETKSFADQLELLNNYIFEMEVLELPGWADKGQELLRPIAEAQG